MVTSNRKCPLKRGQGPWKPPAPFREHSYFSLGKSLCDRWPCGTAWPESEDIPFVCQTFPGETCWPWVDVTQRAGSSLFLLYHLVRQCIHTSPSRPWSPSCARTRAHTHTHTHTHTRTAQSLIWIPSPLSVFHSLMGRKICVNKSHRSSRCGSVVSKSD